MLTSAENFQQLTCNRHVRDNLRAKSLRAALLTGTAGFADFSLRIGSTAVLARLLAPEHFGLIMMVTAVTAVADQVREMGLSTATVQSPDITHERATNLFWLSTGIGVAIAVLICATAPLLAFYYHEQRLIAITCALSATFVFGGLMTQHQALLTRQLKLGHTSTIRFTSSLVSTAVAIALAISGFEFWSLVWREVLRGAVMTAGMWLCFPWCPGLPRRHTSIRDLLRFGADLTGANILSSLSSSADRLLLGRFWGASAVALYRQAYQLLLTPMDQLLSPLFQVSQPSLSLIQNQAPRYRRYFLKLITAVCVVTMPASIFIAVYSTEITRLLLGPKWLDCAPVLLLLSLATFIRQPVSFTGLALLTRGKSRVYLYLTTAQQIAFLGALAVGVAWGPKGVALGEIAVTYLMIAPALYFTLAGSPVGLRDVLAIYGRVGGISLAMGAGLLLYRLVEIHATLPFRLASAAAISALLFLGLWLALPIGRREFSELLRDLAEALRKRAPARAAVASTAHVFGSSSDALRSAQPVAPKN
jgi:PST family polysaccharide transporter